MIRTTLIAGLAAAGIGLAGTSGASAVPANGTVINDLATTTDHVTPVRWWGHWRWGSRGYYHRRWGYGYGGRYGYGGHWRWGSRGWRRW
jgi:ABC-type glycerol-3-phosphate transport system substrate-binding protein